MKAMTKLPAVRIEDLIPNDLPTGPALEEALKKLIAEIERLGNLVSPDCNVRQLKIGNLRDMLQTQKRARITLTVHQLEGLSFRDACSTIETGLASHIRNLDHKRRDSALMTTTGSEPAFVERRPQYNPK